MIYANKLHFVGILHKLFGSSSLLYFDAVKAYFKKDCAHIQTKQFIYLLLRWLILCVLNMTDFSSMVILAISYAIEVGFALIFYDDAFLIRFFWGSMYTIICLVADYITLFIPQTFSHITSPDLLMGGALRMPFSLLYIALTAVLVFLLHCMSDRKIQLSVIQKISYFAICISGILIGHYIMVITLEAEKQFHDPDFTSKLVLVNLVFLILFLFLLLYIYQLGDSKQSILLCSKSSDYMNWKKWNIKPLSILQKHYEK